MWKPAKRELYALVALLDLHAHGRDGWVRLADIAARQSMPLPFLERIAASLCQAELIVARRGPGGGLRLGRPLEHIALGQVRTALSLLDPSAPSAPRSVQELVEQELCAMAKLARQHLDTLTLDRLAARAVQLGLCSSPEPVLQYEI